MFAAVQRLAPEGNRLFHSEFVDPLATAEMSRLSSKLIKMQVNCSNDDGEIDEKAISTAKRHHFVDSNRARMLQSDSSVVSSNWL